ncbi:MAG: HAD family phosphatase [Candidatus Nanopelagicales bacterium]|jgi:epoxide hydrolase-like predicted phosphatase|nr:HAD family phosphatase [Candidatus Nanopelagicales bacterium]
MTALEKKPTALIVDWGGVLTNGLDHMLTNWTGQENIDLDVYYKVFNEWLGPEVEKELRINPIHALEKGEMSVPDFEVELAHALLTLGNIKVNPTGLLDRMFQFFEHAPDMNGLVHRARKKGIKTALLSNSWGNNYPRHGWDDMFDEVIISGEVGMRKPDAEIYHHTLELLKVKPTESVFVDDLAHNIKGAAELGMIGVLHVDYDSTKMELEAIFNEKLD